MEKYINIKNQGIVETIDEFDSNEFESYLDFKIVPLSVTNWSNAFKHSAAVVLYTLIPIFAQNETWVYRSW